MLKMQPTNRANTYNNTALIERVTEDMCTVLDRFNYLYSRHVIRGYAQDWLREKGDILELMRNHPEWDEERLAIVHDTAIHVDREMEHVYQAYTDIIELIGDHKSGHPALLDTTKALRGLRSLMYARDEETTLKPHHVTRLEMYFTDEQFALVKDGQKVTRLVRAILKEAGYLDISVPTLQEWTDANGQYHSRMVDHGIEWHLARLGDAYNPPKGKRTFYLSIHPIDYLTMSPNPYHHLFNSCHHLGDNDDGGCYHSGCFSYLGDSSCLIMYTTDTPEERIIERKTHRQCLFIDSARRGFLSSRIYPTVDSQPTIYREYRNVAQEIWSACTGYTGKYYLLEPRESYDDNGYLYYIDEVDDPRHYPDYSEHYNALFRYSVPEGEEPCIIHIGADVVCLNCGDEVDDQYLICPSCKSIGECEYCGNYIQEAVHDYVTANDGNMYCCSYHAEQAGYMSYYGVWYHESEMVTCDYCEEYVPELEAYELDGYYFCCQSCRDDYEREHEDDAEIA